MHDFTYTAHAAYVEFGPGAIDRLGRVIEAVGGTRALILSTPRQAEKARALGDRLGAVVVGYFPEAVMHTPVDVTQKALDAAKAANADVTIAYGGGSTIGLGKAIALHTDIPQIAIPTTYAGSEMTPYIGQTEDGRKTTQRTPKVLPKAVVYDVDLTLSLPVPVSMTSGLNAIAHAVEALYAKETNPIIDMMAEEGIRALVSALPGIKARPDDKDARADALYGAWLCSLVLGAVGMALHHKLCHTIGGMFNTPHAETHAIILPHATAYNAPATPEAMQRLARALGTDGDPATALYELARRLGVPMGLQALGVPEDGLDRVVAETLKNPYWNPRPLEQAELVGLLQRAWQGGIPQS